MDKITVEHGKTYQAILQLRGMESWASNEQVNEKLRELGFSHVKVTGEGHTREVRGTWTKDDTTVDMPVQVDHVREVKSDGTVQQVVKSPEPDKQPDADEGDDERDDRGYWDDDGGGRS